MILYELHNNILIFKSELVNASACKPLQLLNLRDKYMFYGCMVCICTQVQPSLYTNRITYF